MRQLAFQIDSPSSKKNKALTLCFGEVEAATSLQRFQGISRGYTENELSALVSPGDKKTLSMLLRLEKTIRREKNEKQIAFTNVRVADTFALEILRALANSGTT